MTTFGEHLSVHRNNVLGITYSDGQRYPNFYRPNGFCDDGEGNEMVRVDMFFRGRFRYLGGIPINNLLGMEETYVVEDDNFQ